MHMTPEERIATALEALVAVTRAQYELDMTTWTRALAHQQERAKKRAKKRDDDGREPWQR
jgi:hypothetical protein